MEIKTVNLKEVWLIYWLLSPKIVAELNGQLVKSLNLKMSL
jgi:hypothetical protein